MSGRFESSHTAIIRAPRPLVWAVISDTNRVDRAMGLVPPRYEWHREGQKNLRLAKASELGIALEWIEPPYQWAEGQFVRGLRRYRRGPVEEAGFVVSLRDVPEGTEVTACVTLQAPWYIRLIQRFKLASGLRRYFRGLEAVFAKGAEGDSSLDEPAVAKAKKVLSQGYVPETGGPRAKVNEQQLELRANRLQGTVAPDALAHLLRWLREQPDDDVSSMRPFELATLWGLDRREVLRMFLRATEAGLVDLQWQINCPVCRVGAKVVSHLDEVGQSSHCGACEIDYGVDFGKHVEATFPCHPAVREVFPVLYCASSPAFLPHVTAQFRPAASSVQDEVVTFPPGELLIRSQWQKHDAHLVLDHLPEALEVTIGKDALTLTPSGVSSDGTTRLKIDNQTDDEAALIIERTNWNADAVLGTVIASLPEFTNLFATEAPALGVELKVGFVALLFSDLTGSTALYEKVGDARAFAIVEEHFRVAEVQIAKHGGAIVKTMGDAVMASFASLSDATAAGIAMVKAHDERFAKDELTIKVGVHGGPCLVVRANDRLDYFGTTVNVSARLQAQAGPSEVVLTEANAADVSVAAAIGALRRRPFQAKLKGIREEQQLTAILVER
jgi:class 3 adenylate cyclase